METWVMCYKSEMSKIIERWLLFEYVHGEFTPLIQAIQNEGTGGEGAREIS